MEHALDLILDKFPGVRLQGPLALLECVEAALGWEWLPWIVTQQWELERESVNMAQTGAPAQI